MGYGALCSTTLSICVVSARGSSDKNLTALPPEIGELTNLTELDLKHNQLATLPPEISNLKNLTALDLKDNRFPTFLPEICKLTNLKFLNLECNQINALAEEIKQLINLKWLNLKENQLSTFPEERIIQLKNLKVLDLNNNPFTACLYENQNGSDLPIFDINDSFLSIPSNGLRNYVERGGQIICSEQVNNNELSLLSSSTEKNLKNQEFPPHIVKQYIVKEYARRFGIRIFIETGTYLGTMINAVKKSFRKICSIEIGKYLHNQAKNRFSEYDYILIHHGDSSSILPQILRNIHEPVLFWLDAHHSGGVTEKGEKETPILEELECILRHDIKDNIILIDDARCFIGKNDYPTIRELNLIIKHLDCIFTVKDDIIRIHRKRG